MMSCVPSSLLSLILAGSRDTRVLVWDAQTAAPVQTLEGHKWQVSDIAIGADGTIISSSLDGCGLGVAAGTESRHMATCPLLT